MESALHISQRFYLCPFHRNLCNQTQTIYLIGIPKKTLTLTSVWKLNQKSDGIN